MIPWRPFRRSRAGLPSIQGSWQVKMDSNFTSQAITNVFRKPRSGSWPSSTKFISPSNCFRFSVLILTSFIKLHLTGYYRAIDCDDGKERLSAVLTRAKTTTIAPSRRPRRGANINYADTEDRTFHMGKATFILHLQSYRGLSKQFLFTTKFISSWTIVLQGWMSCVCMYVSPCFMDFHDGITFECMR